MLTLTNLGRTPNKEWKRYLLFTFDFFSSSISLMDDRFIYIYIDTIYFEFMKFVLNYHVKIPIGFFYGQNSYTEMVL